MERRWRPRQYSVFLGIIGKDRSCRLVLIWRWSCIECVTVHLLGPEKGQTNRIFLQFENEKNTLWHQTMKEKYIDIGNTMQILFVSCIDLMNIWSAHMFYSIFISSVKRRLQWIFKSHTSCTSSIYLRILFPVHFVAFCFYSQANFSTSAKSRKFFCAKFVLNFWHFH